MIKTVILMMLVCAIMVQSKKEKITGLTVKLCTGVDNCTDKKACKSTAEPVDVEATCHDDGTITVDGKTYSKNGECSTQTVLFIRTSSQAKWETGCGATSGSIEVATTVLFSMVAILFL